jgi:glutamyl-tRNA reductase
VTLILAGFDHRTASLDQREASSVSGERLRAALESLRDGGLSEVAILSTCNRLEIVAAVEDAQAGFSIIQNFFDNQAFVGTGRALSLQDRIRLSLYFREGTAVIEHLMRVAAGLESLVLGETQIMGQVARALDTAKSAGTDGAILNRLFEAALHTGKRARSETAISRGRLSVSGAAVSLIKAHIGGISDTRVVVIGAGEMAELALLALQMQGVRALAVANRTDEKGRVLAARLGIGALRWADLPQALNDFDAVIAATSAPQPILCAGDVPAGHSLLLVDIGLPRNINADVKQLPGCRLYNIDDLQAVLADTRASRQAEVAGVEAIIAQERNTFFAWMQSRAVAPIISELRQQAEALAQAEVEQTLRRLPGLNPHEQEIISQLAHRIVNKLLHTPTTTLKARANDDYQAAVRQLFRLEALSAESLGHE